MNEKKEYLNEEHYQNNSKKLKKVGKILLILGISASVVGSLFIIIGVFVLGNTAVSSIASQSINDSSTVRGSLGGFGLAALGGFIDSIGFPLIIAGGVTMFIGHRREITAFTVQQTMPVAQEGIEKMAPTVGSAAKEIAKGIKEGINEADNREEK